MSAVETEVVRSWAKDNGYEVGARGRIPVEIREAWQAEQASAEPGPELPEVDTPLADGPAAGEVKPKRDGFKEKFKRSATSKVGAKSRVTAEPLLGSAWSLAATGLVMSGTDIPVGRCMMLQAPAAGLMLDKAIEGTLPDRMLVQPLARAGARGANLSALVGPPLMVAIIERNPALYEPLKPMLRGLLTAYLVETWPQVKKMRENEAKAMQALGEMAGEGVPDVDTLLDSLFAPPGWAGPAEEGPDAEQDVA